MRARPRLPSILRAVPLLALTLSACHGEADRPKTAPGLPADGATGREARVMRLLDVLASDTMEGRLAGSAGERRARDVIVRELARSGVRPAGEDGYLQRVPLVGAPDGEGRVRWRLPGAGADAGETARGEAWNVLGLIPGSDPERADEIVVVGAHYDHAGMGGQALPGHPAAVGGDSVYNGADDDASGTVAVLDVARALAREGGAARSVLVALFSAEEHGLLGPRWFLVHPTVPLARIVVDLQIEMIGRPDSLVGGPGRGWLTGYERSTVGDLLRAQGSPIVRDPRPEMRFFFRSDNLPFAEAGIPAHTLSSYGMHPDYHTPDDEVERIDGAHLSALVEAALALVRDLANGPRPQWHEGGRPPPPAGDRPPR